MVFGFSGGALFGDDTEALYNEMLGGGEAMVWSSLAVAGKGFDTA